MDRITIIPPHQKVITSHIPISCSADSVMTAKGSLNFGQFFSTNNSRPSEHEQRNSRDRAIHLPTALAQNDFNFALKPSIVVTMANRTYLDQRPLSGIETSRFGPCSVRSNCGRLWSKRFSRSEERRDQFTKIIQKTEKDLWQRL
jgi:hypothetical protein